MFSRDKRPLGDFAETLLDIARRSIAKGLGEGEPLEVNPSTFAPELRVPRASFVTLRHGGKLRGCVGSLEARESLIVNVAQIAYKAAFMDTRFSPLSEPELADLEVHISVLSPLQPLEASSEDLLIEQLRPKIDGLVLREGQLQSTFLPAVWDSVSESRAFLRELKQKAGLPPDYWSSTLRFYRYTVESIP